jgi:hypothetical protein
MTLACLLHDRQRLNNGYKPSSPCVIRYPYPFTRGRGKVGVSSDNPFAFLFSPPVPDT